MTTDRPRRVVALAGRRIDAPDAPVPRFPLAHVPRVRERLRELLVRHHPSTLVASAACGSDLLALDEATALGIRTRIVLPFPPARFRETSVVDRPGDWGGLFDRLVKVTASRGDLVLLQALGEESEAYLAANEALVDEALHLAGTHGEAAETEGGVLAVIVWEGQPRGDGDATAHFADLARARSVPIVEISTR